MPDPFSTDIPELLKNHLEHLTASAISLDVIRERGYKSVLGKTPLKKAGFSKAQQRHPGILIPLHGVDGQVVSHQYRPNHPRQDSRRDRAIKYENPIGASVRLDVPPRCLKHLGDPATPLYITEGVKKVDSLASAGACAIGLTGVWGFKGKNIFGGTTLLADFDYIALKNRPVYLVFDSDSSSNTHVAQALNRLLEHLKRKGAATHVIRLPDGPEGAKVGADDYLAAGHTLEEMTKLEILEASLRPTLLQRTGGLYVVEEGRICFVKQTQQGEVIEPLCNFDARITEIVTRDNGLDSSKSFKIAGVDGSGHPLPILEVLTSSFVTMNWVTTEWDTRAIISASQSAKPRLCEAMLLQSQDAERREVYSHTGWRDIEGQPVFLTASGAIGMEEVDVEVDDDLKDYALPSPVEDPTEALKASYDFLNIGPMDTLMPLWATMYLAPLSEILDPAFTLFIVGHSGSFKSTVTALALNHFGPHFDENHLPAAWRDTENKLEKLLFLCKDLPLVIDDWAPGSDSSKARELEVKAEHVIRAQGNRQGKGRLRSDTSSRKTYIPRGLLITSGEQLPSGHSHTARIFTVEISGAEINRSRLSAAQDKRHLYCIAMTHYILWLKQKHSELKNDLPQQFAVWRNTAFNDENHPRLAGEIAWLYTGYSLALDFLTDHGIITEAEAKSKGAEGWEILTRLSSIQSGRVEDERPGKRFIEVLRTGLDMGKFSLWSKDDDELRRPGPGETPIGWTDAEGHVYLNPMAAYAAVRQYCQHMDSPFTIKQSAVWKDLKLLNYIDACNGRNQSNVRIYGEVKSVIKLRPSVFHNGYHAQEVMEI